jgi:long-chain acyl-CoA synthetase
LSIEGNTITAAFGRTLQARPDAVALCSTNGDARRAWTWAQYADGAARVAAALAGLGVRRGDRVALMVRNRPEFHLADMGALLLGATPFSIYNSSAPEQIAYLLAHSEAKVAIVEDAEFLQRLEQARAQLPDLAHVIAVDPARDAIAYDALLQSDPLDVDAAIAVARPDDLATIVYTSGTTGPPKGAAITHANFAWMIERFQRRLGIDLAGRPVISYLPMAHVLERDVSHYLHVATGAQVTTCPDPSQIGAYLTAVRPAFFAAVPRVWEKLCSAVQSQGLTGAAARELIGLDACEAAFSGGAPIPPEVHRSLREIGVPLGEAYGLTESSFVVTYDVARARVGSVGRALDDVELRIADDGEVLARGPFVFDGYLKDPARTAEAVSADGWLHTGDIGEIDDAGYLRIVDRRKELIITAGGKNISPANLEAAVKSHPLIGQACVVGDRRPFLVALLVLDAEMAARWAAERGLEPMTAAALAAHPLVLAEIETYVETVNRRVSRTEQIKRFALLDEEWPVDSDLLTPTMKLKRRGVLARYAGELDAMYASAARQGAAVPA